MENINCKRDGVEVFQKFAKTFATQAHHPCQRRRRGGAPGVASVEIALLGQSWARVKIIHETANKICAYSTADPSPSSLDKAFGNPFPNFLFGVGYD